MLINLFTIRIVSNFLETRKSNENFESFGGIRKPIDKLYLFCQLKLKIMIKEQKCLAACGKCNGHRSLLVPSAILYDVMTSMAYRMSGLILYVVGHYNLVPSSAGASTGHV